MRVTIKHEEVTQGLVSKKPYSQVTLRIVFNEQEQFIIRKYELAGMTILERDPPPGKKEDEANRTKYYLTLRGGSADWEDVFLFRYPIEAKQYIEELRNALQTFKQFLDGNKEIEEPTIAYEL